MDAVVAVDAVFREATAAPRIAAISMAHLSVELGHLYKEDFDAGPERLRTMFARIAPWARTAEQECVNEVSPRTARISTCFLVDDYFTQIAPPDKVVPALLEAAREFDIRIDYLARESGCAEADGVALTDVVLGRIVEDPSPGSTGARPPATEIGWLCNGERSTGGGVGEAMSSRPEWTPPHQNSYNRHSIFIDVEMWSDTTDRRTWSCSFLATVWQLLRLGLLRNLGEPVASPQPMPTPLPQEWAAMPAVARLNPSAAAFSAYRTFSVLDRRFLETEHAVRSVLNQIATERGVIEQTLQRASAEGIALPPDIVDRISYAFVGSRAG